MRQLGVHGTFGVVARSGEAQAKVWWHRRVQVRSVTGFRTRKTGTGTTAAVRVSLLAVGRPHGHDLGKQRLTEADRSPGCGSRLKRVVQELQKGRSGCAAGKD